MEQIGPVILHSFKKNGEVYPPTHVECQICAYVKSELVLNFSSFDVECACAALSKYVDPHDWCSNFDLNRSAVSDEVLERIDKLEARGKLPRQSEELTEKEMEEFYL